MAKTDVKDVTAMLQKLQDVDALGFTVIISAGVAGYCGVKGPLTSILTAIAPVNGSGKSVMEFNPGEAWLIADLVGTPILGPFLALFGGATSGGTTTNPTPTQISALGTAAANMVEAGLLYQLARNPETLKTLFDMGKEAANGAIGLGKTGAALLK
jgi:hypothetical protein